MAAHIARHHPQVTWLCPQLPPSPQQAMQEVAQAIANWPSTRMAVVGSSLGGFYATWVAQRQACRAVLLNPAVHPARDLEKYIGAQTQFHTPEESFYFRPEYIQELRDLETGALGTPQHFFTVIAKGDEVLDWHEMVERYQRGQCLLLEGGDHALSHFDQLLPAILQHLNLTEGAPT